MKSIMLKSTDLRPVIGEVGRTRHDHFLSWCFPLVGHYESYGEKKKNKHSMSGWWCGARVENRATGGRLFSSQGWTRCARPNRCFRVRGARWRVRQPCSARQKLVSNLLSGSRLRIVVRRLEDGSQRKITDAVRQFVSADNQRG